MPKAESQDITGAPIDHRLGKLQDAFRAFLSVPGDDLRPAPDRLVDDLIEALNSVDGDPDVEPNGDELGDGLVDDEDNGDGEPSLGSTVVHEIREHEHDGSEPDVDDEPSLGSFDRIVNQADSWRQRECWVTGCDREQDDADREADEPLLTECADGLEAFR